MPPTTTRTLNPLPFGDLEPKRFEDLIRQLAHDFRPWRQLEATGRAGSDDGFDARGYETTETSWLTEEDDAAADGIPAQPLDRVWLIQCKRERSIPPAKMKSHLLAIPEESYKGLYGFIFAACCDFSKKSRDEFRFWCASHNINNAIIWGKAEIEDMLFRPENDGILFAYFGISLQIQRRRIGADIRRSIAIKRKIKRILDGARRDGKPVLIRDISDDRYPHPGEKNSLVESKAKWLPCYCIGSAIDGVCFVLKRFWAFYSWEEEKWDFASKINHALPHQHENPWYAFQTEEGHDDHVRSIVNFWDMLPSGQKCFFVVAGIIKFEDIIEIDDVEDLLLKIPTIFVSFNSDNLPLDRVRFWIEPRDGYGQTQAAESDKHVLVFPDELRNLEWEKQFFDAHEIKRATERHQVELKEPEWKKKMREEKGK